MCSQVPTVRNAADISLADVNEAAQALEACVSQAVQELKECLEEVARLREEHACLQAQARAAAKLPQDPGESPSGLQAVISSAVQLITPRK